MESQTGGGRPSSARRWFELEPPAPERLELQTSPRVSTVASYVFTRAAERSWELLNQHLEEPHGGVFWIGGPAGCGKTHFLDYVIALQRRAGALDSQNARRLVCGLELAGRITGAEVEMFLLSVLAEQIGGDQRAGDLFRQLRGAAALNVALETARRTGINSVTVAIDFGTSHSDALADFFAMLAQVAATFRQVKFTVIAAGRAIPPEATHPLMVAPHDPNEETTIAVRRARRLLDHAELYADHAYAGIDTAGLAPGRDLPVPSERTQGTSINRQPSILPMARDPIVPRSCPCRASHARCWRRRRWLATKCRARLIYPPDLTMNPEISKLLKVLLPEAGRAAWKIARDTIAGFDPYRQGPRARNSRFADRRECLRRDGGAPHRAAEVAVADLRNQHDCEIARDAGRPRFAPPTRGLYRRRHPGWRPTLPGSTRPPLARRNWLRSTRR